MKYCKKCGVLYSTDVCPKCGMIEPQASQPEETASAKEIRRRWIALGIAIPSAILLIMGVIKLYFILIH